MSFQNVGQEEFRVGMEREGAVVLDVRTPGEWHEGVIPGAELINVMDPTFADRIDALDRTKPYYVYCRSGNRSGMVSSFMMQRGFTEVFNLSDGLISWDGALVQYV